MVHVKRLAFIALAVLCYAVPVFAMSSAAGCGGDCTSCHAITIQEANTLLKEIGTVTSVKQAPVRGLYEVTIEQGGQKGIAYLDYGKKHIIGGQIFDLATRQLAGAPAQPAKPLERIEQSKIDTASAIVMGNPKGNKKLIVFTDPECPFCAKLHGELKKLVKLEPDLAVYIKLYPLKMHPHAYDKARVILGRKSLALLEKSFAKEELPAPGPGDDRKPVDDTMSFAESIGINATPTLVLPDGRILLGYKDAETMRGLLR